MVNKICSSILTYIYHIIIDDFDKFITIIRLLLSPDYILLRIKQVIYYE